MTNNAAAVCPPGVRLGSYFHQICLTCRRIKRHGFQTDLLLVGSSTQQHSCWSVLQLALRKFLAVVSGRIGLPMKEPRAETLRVARGSQSR